MKMKSPFMSTIFFILLMIYLGVPSSSLSAESRSMQKLPRILFVDNDCYRPAKPPPPPSPPHGPPPVLLHFRHSLPDRTSESKRSFNQNGDYAPDI